ncbi:MAG: type II toxin-antitoxin system RelE/ParE family toxin [Comamonadaceae bacterium]|nr:type II toxin-antitoxin system RelE/ParE family toxin [Comamonadaceae bacterium]
MTIWTLSPEVADDLDRLVEVLLDEWPLGATATVDMVVEALHILAQHPKIGRPVAHGLRELVISRGKSGYLALYDYDEQHDMVIVLALRHQREAGYR